MTSNPNNVDSQLQIDELIRLLGERNPNVYMRASEELAKIGEPAIPKLLELLRGSKDEIKAGITLGMIKNRKVVPELIELCKNERVSVRRGAITALGGIGDPSALTTLIDALGDPNPDIQTYAATALMEMHDPSSIPALVKALRDSQGDFNFAGIALASFGEQALPHLLDAIRNGYAHEMMGMAMESIGKPAVPPLSELLDAQDVEWYVSHKVAGYLGAIGDSSAIPALKRALFKGDDGLTDSAAWALSVIKDRAARDALLDALGSDDPMVRGLVADALRNIKDDVVVRALVPLLSDNRPVWESAQAKPIRIADIVAETLEFIGTERALQALKTWRARTKS